MSTSEQTSASKRAVGYYWVRQHKGSNWAPAYWMQTISGSFWILDNVTWEGDKYFNEIDERRIERPSPQQQPDTTLDNPNLEQLIKAMFPAHNYGTSNKQKVANATSTAGQPDELSKAQARIRELAAENAKLRAELLKQSQHAQSWYSHEVRELLGLFKQPYTGAGFPESTDQPKP